MKTNNADLITPTAFFPHLNKLLAIVLSCAFLTGGCANPEVTRWVSTISGGLLGALVGKWVGGDKGAFWGGVLGAGFGFGVGQVIYKNQRDLETRRKVLASSIAEASKVLDEHRAYNKHLEEQIKKVNEALQRITDSQSKGEITAVQAQQMRQELVPGIDSMSQEAKQTAQTLQEFTRKAEASEQKAQLLKEIAELKQENDKLDKLLENIAAQRTTAGQ